MKSFRVALSLLAAGAAIFCVPPSAQAQTALYGMYGGASSGVVNTGNLYGPTFGAYFDRGTFINGGIDIRGTFLSDGNLTQFDSGMAGLRLAVKPHIIPFDPYGELLVGGAHANYGQGSAKTTKNSLGYEAVVGADFTILPHIDWRVLEFSYSNVTGGGISPKALSTGIVVRLF